MKWKGRGILIFTWRTSNYQKLFVFFLSKKGLKFWNRQRKEGKDAEFQFFGGSFILFEVLFHVFNWYLLTWQTGRIQNKKAGNFIVFFNLFFFFNNMIHCFFSLKYQAGRRELLLSVSFLRLISFMSLF